MSEKEFFEQKLSKKDASTNMSNLPTNHNFEIESLMKIAYSNTASDATNTKFDNIIATEIKEIPELMESISQITDNTKAEIIKTTLYNAVTTKASLNKNTKGKLTNKSESHHSFSKTSRPKTTEKNFKDLIKIENLSHVIKKSLSPPQTNKGRPFSNTKETVNKGRPFSNTKETVNKGFKPKRSFRAVFVEKLRPTTAKVFQKKIDLNVQHKEIQSDCITEDEFDTYKSTKVNTMYFNDYIDLKFRPMNQNFGRFLNSYKKEEATHVLKNKVLLENPNKIVFSHKSQSKNNFADLIKVENYRPKESYKETTEYNNRIKPKSALLRKK